MLSRKLIRQLTPDVLRRALRVLKLAERRRKLMVAVALIDGEMAKLEGQTVRRGPGRPPKTDTRGRYKRTAEMRARMAKAQQERWEKVRAKEKAESATG